MTTAEGTETSGTEAGLRAEMESLSLAQALVDFEIANARVLDLTQRLVEGAATISRLQTELHGLKIEHAQMRADYEGMKSSRAFRAVEKVRTLRNVFRV